MSKLYYTNPLHAAIMAEEFGVKLLDEDYQQYLDDGLHIFFAMGGPAEHGDGKYYIHPDSYHVFEPKFEDLGRSLDGCMAWFNRERGGRWQNIYCCADNDYFDDAKTIQRDNKPFFMPEVDNE